MRLKKRKKIIIKWNGKKNWKYKIKNNFWKLRKIKFWFIRKNKIIKK